jgi:hypothetical protein
MTEWKPISTAPKDGSRILACWVDGDGHTIIEWFDYHGGETGTWCQRAPGLGSDCGYEDGAFSHWMPLPDLPKGDER